jgi:translocation and assembly module TamB
MVNPIFARGKKPRDAERQPAPGGNVQSPQLFGQMQLSGVDIDGNFMPFDMQPSQMAMNFNGMSSTLQRTVHAAGANQPER